MKVTEDDGNKSDFYFSDNGRGYNGVKDNYLYYKGKLQKATDGQKYVCYEVDNKNYVVNSSGKVMKSAKLATGFEIQVPLFVEIGDKIEIDTRTGEYRSRSK